MKKIIITALLAITYNTSLSQISSANPKIKLDTVVYLGERENWNAQHYYREMKYDYFDSTVYYCHYTNINPHKVTIPFYDLKNFRLDSLTTDESFLAEEITTPIVYRLSVTENAVLIYVQGFLMFFQRNGNILKMKKQIITNKPYHYIALLNDSSALLTICDYIPGNPNEPYTQITVLDLANNNVLYQTQYKDPSSYSWKIHGKRIFTKNGKVYTSCKWLSNYKIFSGDLTQLDSGTLDSYMRFNYMHSDYRSQQIIEKMDSIYGGSQKFYDEFDEFMGQLYNVKYFEALNDSTIIAVYSKGWSTYYEILSLEGNNLVRKGISPDNSPADTEVLTPYNIHHVFLRRTLLIKEGKVIVMEYTPKLYPIGMQKGEFYERTLVTEPDMEGCELSIYLFSVEY